MQNPLSTEALVTWLKKKPANGRYLYSQHNACVLYQYLSAAGLPVASVRPEEWLDTEGKRHLLPRGWEHVANGFDQFGHPKRTTFGFALKRAEALLAKPKRTAKKRVAA